MKKNDVLFSCRTDARFLYKVIYRLYIHRCRAPAAVPASHILSEARRGSANFWIVRLMATSNPSPCTATHTRECNSPSKANTLVEAMKTCSRLQLHCPQRLQRATPAVLHSLKAHALDWHLGLHFHCREVTLTYVCLNKHTLLTIPDYFRLFWTRSQRDASWRHIMMHHNDS